jgi:hypothetical protein
MPAPGEPAEALDRDTAAKRVAMMALWRIGRQQRHFDG